VNPYDQKYIRQTLAMALGAILMSPDTDTKSEMAERLKRSIEKVDAQDAVYHVENGVLRPSCDPHFGVKANP